MAYAEITDHVTRALARLKTVFASSVEFRGIISAFALECQALESAILSTRESIRNPDNGSAGNLATMARVAKLVGARPLGNLAAADYVNLINAQVQVNKSQGSPEDAISIYRAMLEPITGPLSTVTDVGDAADPYGYSAGLGVLHILGGDGAPLNLEQARNAMALFKSAAPAGGRTLVTLGIYPVYDVAAPFLCDTSATDSNSFGLLATYDSPSTVR